MSKKNKNGITNITVRFADEDLWLTQKQVAEIYDTTQQNISQHIENVFKDGELQAESTNKKFLLVQTEGNRKVKREIWGGTQLLQNLQQLALIKKVVPRVCSERGK